MSRAGQGHVDLGGAITGKLIFKIGRAFNQVYYCPCSLIVRCFPLTFLDHTKRKPGWLARFRCVESRCGYIKTRRALTTRRPAVSLGLCIASCQEKSEEERGNSTFPEARPGPNHNPMFRLAKYPQVIELKGYYWWAGFVRMLGFW
jgi:hypothetical protein